MKLDNKQLYHLSKGNLALYYASEVLKWVPPVEEDGKEKEDKSLKKKGFALNVAGQR